MPYNNITNNYQSSKYIVDADGSTPFITIQSAIDQAVLDIADGYTPSDTTIMVRAGTYVEDLVLVASINLKGDNQAIIDGTHTPPAAGTIRFENLLFTDATDIMFSAAAGTCAITFSGCDFNVTLGQIINLGNWTGDIIINNCTGTLGQNAIAFNTAGCAIDIVDSRIGSPSAGALTTTGVTRILNSSIFCNCLFDTATSFVLIDSSIVTGLITINDPSTVTIENSVINAGAGVAIATGSTNPCILSNVTIDSTIVGDVITGTGHIEFGEVVFVHDTNTVVGTIIPEQASYVRSMSLNLDGNLNLPDTTTIAGQITIGGDRWISNFDIHNTFVGELSGNTTLTAGVGVENTGIGYNTLNSITTSANCTALGSGALASILTGTNTIALGSGAGSAYVGAESNNILIGSPGVAAETKKIRIGVPGTQDANYQAGIYQASSGATKEVVYIDSNSKLSSSNLGITQWTTATASMNAAVNTGYITKIAVPGLLTYTLPVASAVGDVIEIVGYTVGGWHIAQGAGQQIFMIAANTTLGAGGSIASTQRYDSIKLLCVTANTEWIVIASEGNLTIV